MLKRMFLLALAASLCLAWSVEAEAAGAISVTGSVCNPLHVSLKELSTLAQSHTQRYEVSSDSGFHGVFRYEGVSLRTLLELAQIEKTDTDFRKPIDLAIVVRNKQGSEVVLSWGEVFYRNPADIVLASKATPVMPMTPCEKCHTPEEYTPWRDQLTRAVGLPKLVIADDFYTDRCIEEVAAIEVRDLRPPVKSAKMERLYSPQFSVVGGKKELTIHNLASLPRREIMAAQAGEGKSYHGLRKFSGVPLIEILMDAGIEPNPCSAFLVSAPDGYRSLFSYGELFLAPAGERIIVADTMNGAAIEQNGKFYVVDPTDISADRWVKAVDKIEALDLRDAPTLSVIGVGCGGADLITIEALAALAKSDVLICSSDLKERFAAYLKDKPVLFDPLETLEQLHQEGFHGLSPEERKAKMKEQRAAQAEMVLRALEKGKNVAYLDYGDPMIFGSWRFLSDFIDVERMEFIPGVSSLNAASALTKRDITCNGSVAFTAPQDLPEKEDLIASIARNGDTLVIFMGLKELKNLSPLFLKHFSPETPVCLVYEAGIPAGEKVVRTTLAEAASVAEKEKEKWLGLIYIGPCLLGSSKN
jgi:precorrin-4 methylase